MPTVNDFKLAIAINQDEKDGKVWYVGRITEDEMTGTNHDWDKTFEGATKREVASKVLLAVQEILTKQNAEHELLKTLLLHDPGCFCRQCDPLAHLTPEEQREEDEIRYESEMLGSDDDYDQAPHDPHFHDDTEDY